MENDSIVATKSAFLKQFMNKSPANQENFFGGTGSTTLDKPEFMQTMRDPISRPSLVLKN